MWVTEREIETQWTNSERNIFADIQQQIAGTLNESELALRFVVSKSDEKQAKIEILTLSGTDIGQANENVSAQIRLRPYEATDSFNVALVIPTGVGVSVGGHAGDAGPVAKLLSSVADTLVTHPNAVNASDINEMPENALYVEGSVLSRLLLGTIGLQRVRNNRVLVVIDDHEDEIFTNAAINAVNGARATYGLSCSEIIKINPRVRLSASYSASGRAIGEVENLDFLIQVLKDRRDQYDAVALSSVINVPADYHQKYFDEGGEMVNPWGGVEAMLTHSVSTLLDVQSAHSPMFETRDIANVDPGIVEPRLAAEAVSLTFLQCILKGLQRSPRIVSDQPLGQQALFDATNISCLVIPDGCLGIPTLAALAQGIQVIAVRDDGNLMQNKLARLPWRPGQFLVAENYWEAAGLVAAIRAGIDPSSVRRPFPPATVKLEKFSLDVHDTINKKELAKNDS